MAAFFRLVRTVVACLLLLIFVGILYPTFALAEDWRFPFVIFLPAGVVGSAMLRGVLRERKRLAREDAEAREVAVLRLAVKEGGALTATQVAARLGCPIDTALATLRALEDSGHVKSAVTGNGVLVFEFREVMHDLARLHAPAEAVAEVADTEKAISEVADTEAAVAEPVKKRVR